MNDEKSGELEDRRKEALNDSVNSGSETRQAVDGNGSEDLKPPDSKRFQLQMDETLEKIRETEEKLKSLEKQVSASGGKFNKTAVPVDKEKLLNELQDLRTQREKVIEERKQCDVELKGLNVQVQKKNDACTKLQAAVRYKSEARIDEAVRRLEHQMQVQQLKLSEEKRIVAEIDTLKRSKRSLNEYLVLKQHVDQLRNKQKHLRSQRDACVKRITGFKAREEKVKNLLDADVSDESEDAQRQHTEQLNTVELLKTELNELHTKKRELKARFTKEKNDYYAAIREIKTQKQREESVRRKNEKQTMLKALASSRTTEQLHEKEKSLCETLINHLEKLHISATHLPDLHTAALPDKEPVISLSASADFSLSGEGMFLRRKSDADDLVGVFAGVHRTSRRGSRKGRRSSAKEVPRKLNLHPQVVEHLLTLGLSPPSTAADIPKVLEELQEKKELYDSVPSFSPMLALTSNDPMSPISEEAAPVFPTKFEETYGSKTPDGSAQAEDSTENADVDTGGKYLQNSHSLLSLTEAEKVSVSKNVDEVNTESAENLSSSLPERDDEVSKAGTVELEKAASSETFTEPAITSGNSDVAVNEEANIHIPIHTTNGPSQENLSAKNDDLCDADEAITNCSEIQNCNHVMEEKLELPANDQVHTAKTSIAPKENTFIPHLQSNTSCTEQACLNSSSTHSANLLLEQNGLEAAYDKTSLNDGHSIGKIQCEKCPA